MAAVNSVSVVHYLFIYHRRKTDVNTCFQFSTMKIHLLLKIMEHQNTSFIMSNMLKIFIIKMYRKWV